MAAHASQSIHNTPEHRLGTKTELMAPPAGGTGARACAEGQPFGDTQPNTLERKLKFENITNENNFCLTNRKA